MDEDDFIYSEEATQQQPPAYFSKPHDDEPQSFPLNIEKSLDGFETENYHDEESQYVAKNEPDDEIEVDFEAQEEDEEEAEEDSEDDVEFIMEPTQRSADFRHRGGRPFQQTRSFSGTTPVTLNQSVNLTTEYTPRERGGGSSETLKQPLTLSQDESFTGATEQEQNAFEDGIDPSTLPPVKAPPSHPSINPDLPGTLDGRSIFEMDMTNLAEKPWRRPGSDISDWFNYGFDEISWEAYCYRRREMGELANVLKANIINFAGMPEEQLLALPPEVRTMVMTGATAMMNAGAPNVAAGMIPPGVGVGMNPMMHDMSALSAMGMGHMGMGMNNEMGMQMPPGGPIMQDVSGIMPGSNMPSIGPGNGTPEQAAVTQMNLQDGFSSAASGSNMMGINMGGEFNMQQEQNNMNNSQPMYQSVESSTPVPLMRGGSSGQYRGRGGSRGRGYMGRGRGRGNINYQPDSAPIVPPVPPPRPASPLPPNVPTGPRNPGNRYKDRDNNGSVLDGLDYGGLIYAGGVDGNGNHTPSNESDDRGSRKRRLSPTEENGRIVRNLKRR